MTVGSTTSTEDDFRAVFFNVFSDCPTMGTAQGQLGERIKRSVFVEGIYVNWGVFVSYERC